MRKVTDMDNVLEVALTFLYLDPQPLDIPLFVAHPFFNSPLFPVPSENGGTKMANVLDDEGSMQQVREHFEKKLQGCKNVHKILYYLQKQYRLVFLQHVRNFLSNEDFSKALGSAYTASENPNSDVDVSVSELKRWFRSADKKYLMSQEEYQHYLELPDHLTVYRGIHDDGNKKGLSWTTDRQKAIWFAKRFCSKGDTCLLLSADIQKSEALAYFSGRNEEEIICQPKTFQCETLKK